jgi:hypothetical protein
LYPSKNNLAFQGENDKLCTPNNGNFLGLVQLLSAQYAQGAHCLSPALCGSISWAESENRSNYYWSHRILVYPPQFLAPVGRQPDMLHHPAHWLLGLFQHTSGWNWTTRWEISHGSFSTATMVPCTIEYHRWTFLARQWRLARRWLWIWIISRLCCLYPYFSMVSKNSTLHGSNALPQL